MSPSLVTLDMSDDIDFTPPPTKTSSNRTLLLAPPSIAAHEEKLHHVFSKHDRSSSDLQMLDRLAAGLITLAPDTYDQILILTDTSDAASALSLLDRKGFATLTSALRVGGVLKTETGGAFGQREEREAILAGLVKNADGGFEKAEEEEVVAIPMKFGKKKTTTSGPGAVSLNKTVTIDLDDDDDDDDIINEDDLMTDADLKRPIVQPIECQPKPGKRRRACKDCSCGLAEQLKQEDDKKRAQADKDLNTMKLNADDLNELDFTVQGKTGSCGNCALGDAFRCDGCPYVGLPAFKPGEEVRLMNDVAQF